VPDRKNLLVALVALFAALLLTHSRLLAADRPAVLAQSSLDKFLKSKLQSAVKRDTTRSSAPATGQAKPGATAAPTQAAGGGSSTATASDSKPGSSGLTPVPAGYRIPEWADRLDILGVKIGMPAEQAIRLIAQHNPNLKITWEQVELANLSAPTIWAVWGREMRHGGAHLEELDFRLALPPQPSVVIEMIRFAIFEEGKEPTLESVLESLHSQYGASFTRIDRNPYLYVSRLDGQKVEQPGRGACYYDLDPVNPMRRQTPMIRLSDFMREFQQVEGQARNAAACGVVVSAVLTPPPSNEQLVASMYLRVSSEPYRIGCLQKTVTHLNQLDQARKDAEAAAARKRGVKL
jgi:hypothetical protein